MLKRPDIQEQFTRIGFKTGGPSRQGMPAFVREQLISWAAAARDAAIVLQ